MTFFDKRAKERGVCSVCVYCHHRLASFARPNQKQRQYEEGEVVYRGLLKFLSRGRKRGRFIAKRYLFLLNKKLFLKAANDHSTTFLQR